MPLTATQYKTLIPVQVGDTGVVATQIETLWTLFEHITPIHLQYLYAKRSAIEVLQGEVWQRVNQAGNGKSADLSDQLAHLQQMLDNTTAEIGRIESGATPLEAQNKGQYVSGELTQTAPVLPPDGSAVDANNRAYRGDAYVRSWRP